MKDEAGNQLFFLVVRNIFWGYEKCTNSSIWRRIVVFRVGKKECSDMTT
jgi:hypothetical protein